MSRGSLKTRIALAVGALASVQAAACATVKPSEREILSRPEMSPGNEQEKHEEEFHAHVEAAREGSMGGHGAAGGGCGCG